MSTPDMLAREVREFPGVVRMSGGWYVPDAVLAQLLRDRATAMGKPLGVDPGHELPPALGFGHK